MSDKTEWFMSHQDPSDRLALIVQEGPDKAMKVVATVIINSANTLYTEGIANARLITAAKRTAAERDELKALNTEMLEALVELLVIADSNELEICRCHVMLAGNICPYCKARTIIAKTEGVA